MADIFISYAREDETRIRELVRAIEEHGWSIFWDRRIPAGKTWETHIGKALSDAKYVIVAWSQQSITSDWVKEEANDAKSRNRLIPVLLDPVTPPLGFRGIQAADLTGWKPGYSSPHFDQLIQDIVEVMGSKPLRSMPEEDLTSRTRPVATPNTIPIGPLPHEPAPPKSGPHKIIEGFVVIALILAFIYAIFLIFFKVTPPAPQRETQPAPKSEVRLPEPQALSPKKLQKPASQQSEPNRSQPTPVSKSPTSLRDALKVYKYNFGWSGGSQLGTETLSPVTMVTFARDDRVFLKYARPGTIEASLRERVLFGTWKDDDGEGDFELRFSKDYSNAKGWWRYKGQEQKYPAMMQRFE